MSLVDELMCMERRWRDTEKRTQSTGRRTSHIATLLFTNPALSGLGLNSGLRGDRPERNYLIHGTASALK
jgi:hypothetical protein